MFKKATKKQCKMRVLLEGASGSGKTWSALIMATEIAKAEGTRLAVIDTEHGSASLYSDSFDFDVKDLKPPYEPEAYIRAIQEAEQAGYGVILIDSMSHEWDGEGGCLDISNKMTGNSFTNWGKITPRHDAFVNAILQSGSHIIATCRSKVDYQLEEGGRKVIKQGTKAKQRDGLDYEMTLVFTLNQNHLANASKDRTGLFTGKDHIITADTAKTLLQWLNSGEVVKSVIDRINECDGIGSLVDLWKSLTPLEQQQNAAAKDAKKAELEG